MSERQIWSGDPRDASHKSGRNFQSRGTWYLAGLAGVWVRVISGGEF